MGGKSSKRDNHEACEACERYYEGTAAASNQGAWHPNYNLYNDGAYWHQGSKENILIHSDPNFKPILKVANFIRCYIFKLAETWFFFKGLFRFGRL